MPDVEFVLSSKGCSATGKLTKTGFEVKAGATVRREITPSAANRVSRQRETLQAEGILQERDGTLTLVKNYEFDSPSGAACVVMGRSANGWTEWKTVDGKTLDSVERNPLPGRLDPTKRSQIIERYQTMFADGQITSEQSLRNQIETFNKKFGPDVLARLEGQPLLEYMHESNQDSLVYWLEYKNDDEFDTRTFGSIAGGSALKFGMFRRKESGEWQSGDPRNIVDISQDEAIEIATKHRDQLLRGVKLLGEVPFNAQDKDYVKLQQDLDASAPDVSGLSWGHKYFSLINPDKLDNYHLAELQRFQLIKLLQLPPEGTGRYECAGRFVAAANELGLSLNVFAGVLNSLHGGIKRYWRIGTKNGKTDVSHWQAMRDNNYIAIGWPQLGDLSWISTHKQSGDKLKSMLSEFYPKNASTTGRHTKQIINFVRKLESGDLVCAADGETVLGVGVVAGEYQFDSQFEFPHMRRVDWVNLDEWKLAERKEGLRTIVSPINKPVNHVSIEKRVAHGAASLITNNSSTGARPKLLGIPASIESSLSRKGQVILYGPPGTGKTYWAEKTANDLAAISSFRLPFEDLSAEQKLEIGGTGDKPGLVRFCCFHPAYGYEDFLEGYRPNTVGNQVSFELRDGIFKKLCEDAANNPKQNFYLIIDEINRGDIPRIFGELLTGIEKNKRGMRIILPVSQRVFSIPSNLFVIGTMNTADRSISLLDAALRRRFSFIELMPDPDVLKGAVVDGIPLRAWFNSLNTRIRENIGRDARNLQIGHSYLMQASSPIRDITALKAAIQDDIIPLLEEYCYEDYATLATILGNELVDVNTQRIRHEHFNDGQESVLIQALLAPYPEINTTTDAVLSDDSEDEDDSELDDADTNSPN